MNRGSQDLKHNLVGKGLSMVTLCYLRRYLVFCQELFRHSEQTGFTLTKDVYDLGGEIEFWLDDEQYMLTKSCMVYVPKGLKHCPIVFRRIDRPIFHFLMVTGGDYS